MAERRLWYPSPVDLTPIIENARAIEGAGSKPLDVDELAALIGEGMKRRRQPEFQAAIEAMQNSRGANERPETYAW